MTRGKIELIRASHATNSGYTLGCRCFECKLAHAEYEHSRRCKDTPPKMFTSPSKQVSTHYVDELMRLSALVSRKAS